ncbi:MAG TPA: hypothetical protein VF042_03270 [Gemmatimonadaceae bacterium]
MITRKSIAIVLGLAGVTLAAATIIADAQTPSKDKVVRVASNTMNNDKNPPKAAPAAAPAPAPVQKPAANEVLINRETFNYGATGRRDPFVSLMNTEELRPLLSDLKLVAVALDPTGRNSVAVLRDMSTKEQYRVKAGQEIGRMRVAAIRAKSVVFGIEEFGYSRQETLAMTVDSTKVRTQ